MPRNGERDPRGFGRSIESVSPPPQGSPSALVHGCLKLEPSVPTLLGK